MIIIAGTHRSGSSYVTRLLHHAGIPLGPAEEYLPADSSNPLGYFEQRSVVDLNSRLITGFSRLHSTIESLACRAIYATCPNPTTFARRAAQLAGEMRAHANRLDRAVIKDPRFSLTYPVWRPLVDFHGIVVVLRHPEASARSMKHRDGIPLWMAFRFWNYHIENLLTWLPHEQTLFVSFDELASANAQDELRRMHAYFSPGCSETRFIQQGKAMFSEELRHWVAQSNHNLPTRTKDLWNALLHLADANRSRYFGGERLRPLPW